MRSALVAVVAALAAVAAGCSGSGISSEPASRLCDRASVFIYVGDSRPLLVRADAVTLEATGRALDLGKPPIATWARSPEGDRLVLGSGDGARLMLADLRTLRRLGTLDLAAKGYVAGLAWPSARRVVAALSGARVEVVVVDSETSRVVARQRLPGAVSRAAGSPDGLVLLVSPQDRIGPATLAVATAAGLRTAALPLEIGVDPPALLEPGLVVSSDGQRALVVPGGARVIEANLRTLALTERELSEPISLFGRFRSWLDPAALAKGPVEGPVRSAAWVAGGRVLVAGSNYRPTGERATVSEAAGVRLIDTGTWSVRTLSAHASTAVVAGDTLLAFGGTQGPAGLRGVGLQAFGSDGHERFHLFGNRFLASVAAVGRYAYVSEQSATTTRIEVVDLTSGRVVRTVRKQTYTSVLPLD